MKNQLPERKAAPAKRAAKARPAPAPGLDLAPVLEILGRLADGELSARAPTAGLDPASDAFRLAMAVNGAAEGAERAVWEERRRIETVEEEIEAACERILLLARDGSLVAYEARADDPAVRHLHEAMAALVELLRTFAAELSDVGRHLSATAREVAEGAAHHEASSSGQAAAIHETTATMEELRHASAQIAENAGSVARTADENLAAAQSGRGAIGNLAEALKRIRAESVAVFDAIARLSKRVERIGTAVEIIDDIADRTDLLALNAALEGSRAGEAGKGFSIVAAEMRRLAENVLGATKEIRSLIGEVREATQAATHAADASRRATEEGDQLGATASQAVFRILDGIKETSDAARVINLATQQQRTATEQVVVSMSEIEGVARQSSEATRQLASASAEMTDLAERLDALCHRFHTA